MCFTLLCRRCCNMHVISLRNVNTHLPCNPNSPPTTPKTKKGPIHGGVGRSVLPHLHQPDVDARRHHVQGRDDAQLVAICR